MHDEMRLHLDRAIERLMARGLSHDAARADARREFGNVAFIQERARDARGVRWLEDAVQDARYALRGLRLKPGFALAVIATLALGIGANATMFGVVDRLLFRPPAYLDAPERSHHLYFARVVNGSEAIGQAYPYQRFLDLARSATSMDVVAAYAPRSLVVGSGEASHMATIGNASASFWRLFKARPAIGRFFTEEEDREPNGARVAVLSHGYWMSRYGGSPGGAQMSAPGQFGQAASNLGVYGGGGSMAPGAKGEIRNPVTVCVIGMVCFLYAIWQMWAMLNELQQATKDPEFKPWDLFIPFLNYYFLWVKVPEQVTRAKQMAGSRNQQAEGIVLDVVLPLYALAKDLNEVWDPNAA